MKKLDVHFFGLCAFVPNTWAGGPAATSWSVLLVDLANFAKVPIAPHFAAIVFPVDEFDVHFKDGNGNMVSRDPDLVISIPSEPKIGVLRLEGVRVELELPGAPAFRPDLTPLSMKHKGPQNAGERRSSLWIPRIGTLLQGSGTLAPNDDLDLFLGNGYPDNRTLAAHLVLKQGTLETSAWAPLSAQNVANIWEFKTVGSGVVVDTQAVAFRATLRSGDLDALKPIRIVDQDNLTTLTPKVDSPKLSILNYELEQLLAWAEGDDITYGTVDSDFDLMYWLAGRHTDPDRSLPSFKKQETIGSGPHGAGSLRRTCGGGVHESFAEDDEAALKEWLKVW